MRPYFKKSIDELEKLFAVAKKSGDLEEMLRLQNELKNRKKPRARALLAKVEEQITALPKRSKPGFREEATVPASSVEDPAPPLPLPSPPDTVPPRIAKPIEEVGPSPEEIVAPVRTVEEETKHLPPPRAPNREGFRRPPKGGRPTPYVPVAPKLSVDEAGRLLAGWTAIEVLSPPQTFRRPVDLAEGDRRRLAEFPADGPLPWEKGERSRPKRKLFYHVALGAIRMDEATIRLLEVFEDTDIERIRAQGFAPIAVLTLDKTGVPAGDSAGAISSFAWGLPIALARDLKSLGAWPDVETKLHEALDKWVRRIDETTGETLPLDRATLRAASDRLLDLLKLPRDLVEPTPFAIRYFQWYKAVEPPDPPPMGSFFLADLARAKGLVAGGAAPANLNRYLGLQRPARYLDLLCDDGLLAQAVAPGVTPPARWPVKGGHPLVTLQQAAVNLATTGEASLLPVNGPPGTGKTTLLRDLVASVVVQRARRMIEFDEPAKAFSYAAKLRTDNAFAHSYRIDERLKGFEIVVASSNNKAVENVSKELPLLGAVDDGFSFRYFASVANAVARGEKMQDDEEGSQQLALFQPETAPPECWGLVSAVLGNARNRAAFTQAAWRHEDHGLRTYLKEAAGDPQVLEIKDSKTGRIVERRKPRIIVEEKPPRNPEDAKRRWRKARSQFRSLLAKVEARLATMEEGRGLLEQITAFDQAASARKVVETLANELVVRKQVVEKTRPEVTRAEQAAEAAAADVRAHATSKPGFLSAILSSPEHAEWKQRSQELEAASTAAGRRRDEALSLMRHLESQVDEAEHRLVDARASLDAASSEVRSLQEKLAPAESLSGHRFADAAFFERDRSDLHRDTPWLDDETNALRAELFGAAMQVHRAFVDAAAKEVRNNLDMLFRTFFGKTASHPTVKPLLPDLWATFHCVVPVVSTTFASVERMLGALPPESIGWLLLDEAGQASPQHAAGAIMRARRTVVVGDPLQLEPVTTLPSQLAEKIAGEFRIDANRFLAPAASVQTLSDASSEYGTVIGDAGTLKRLGVPLIVHRRCADPMFSLSNRVAYGGLMVNGRGTAASSIRDILGPSAWIDVRPGRTEDKWSENEWLALKRMLDRLHAEHRGDPDLYVISPFRIVAQRLRQRMVQLTYLGRTADDREKWVGERVGTIHTVQGREADSVFIVLGAADASRPGARNWAGEKPNLLNVAVTRAKENIYVIGHRYAWASAGHFAHLEQDLPLDMHQRKDNIGQDDSEE